MKLSPVQSLLLMLLVGLSISGWFYGIHWKRVASGDTFTREEKIMIQLQDQIEVLTTENSELSEEIARLKNPEDFDEESIQVKQTPIEPGVMAPFEKVELPKKGL